MNLRHIIASLLSGIVLAASCGGDKTPEYIPQPAVRLTVESVFHTEALVCVESLNCDEVRVMAGAEEAQAPTAEEIVAAGVQTGEDGSVLLRNLIPGTRYCAYGAGRSSTGSVSKVEKVRFITPSLAPDLYPWEASRKAAPDFADITLCPGGGVPNSNRWFSLPEVWDAQRFAPHVSYVGEDGKERWLFEAFLSLSGIDPEGRNFGINPNGRQSAPKESWEEFARYWAGEGGAFSELDNAVGTASARIGSAPPSKRYAVMMMPDPVMLEYFTDKSSSTTYWGSLDGEQLDFSSADDQVRALEWYIDLVRSMFDELRLNNVELAGFYILSEELVALPDGWNYRYKRWDAILPRIGEYLDARNEGLYWIPYLGADGTGIWKDLGITYAWLQPGRYWDTSGDKPIDSSILKIKELGMGIELEFEYSMVEGVMSIPCCMGPDAAGNYVFTLKDVPSLRGRFREYMDAFRESGLYGKERIALYSGSNALWQLANSPETDDIAMYHELCSFIDDNPLRTK